jgi:uncharacterized membrane protein YhaH (DUF805 family)
LKYFIKAIKKYIDFDGRARRAEFWYFHLFYFLFGVFLVLLEGFTGLFSQFEDSVLLIIYQIILGLPSLSVHIRRLHDVDKSGWFLFFPIYSFILFVSEGTAGDNRFGADPKSEEF